MNAIRQSIIGSELFTEVPLQLNHNSSSAGVWTAYHCTVQPNFCKEHQGDSKACIGALQSTNPLARCVEYLQEDLETMTTEFNFWAEERQRFQVEHIGLPAQRHYV